MSRLVFRLGVGIALVALAFVVTDHVLTPPFTPGATEANVKRLRPGMTPEEVDAILGVPAAASSPFGGFGGGFGVPGPGIQKPPREDRMPEKTKQDERVATSDKRDAPSEPAPEDPLAGVRVIVLPKGSARALNEYLTAMLRRMGHPITVPGEGGSAVLYFGTTDRLTRAEWQPTSGSAKTGLIGRLLEWFGW
jgi:hypothetical protein